MINSDEDFNKKIFAEISNNCNNGEHNETDSEENDCEYPSHYS